MSPARYLITSILLAFLLIFVPLEGSGMGSTVQLIDPGAKVESGSFDINWTASDGAVEYVLVESPSSNFSSASILYRGNDNSFTVKDHSKGTFYYRVKPIFENGEGEWSNVESIIIGSTPEGPDPVRMTIDAIPTIIVGLLFVLTFSAIMILVMIGSRSRKHNRANRDKAHW